MQGFQDSDAKFSQCDSYRYILWRKLSESPDICTFIGLNPSTADASYNDPTITRCINFARGFGFGGLAMVNLFAYRATLPEDLKSADKPIGPRNNYWINKAVDSSKVVIACWGNHGKFLQRDQQVLELLEGRELHSFGLNKGGTPKHPLYLKSDTTYSPLDL